MNYNHLNIQSLLPGTEWNRRTPLGTLQYAVGALLYAPGDHKGIGADIIAGRHPALASIALCLEDAVMDHRLAEAEHQLADTLKKIYKALEEGKMPEEKLPMIFVRVRSPGQVRLVAKQAGAAFEIVTGIVIPKFDSANQEAYSAAITEINRNTRLPLYMMPIIESAPVMDKQTRLAELEKIRGALAQVRDYVLNVRVGGNDFCNLYGLRRGKASTIYDIAVMQDILADIMNFFGGEYVVSAPVWEYFGEHGDLAWQEGLRAELALDRLNGFVGKTAIHPSQLEEIQKAYVVSRADHEDACAILHWNAPNTGVAKSPQGLRMNEVKVHQRWAKKMLALASIYGVKE